MPIIRRGKRIKPEDLVKRPRRGRPSPIKIAIEGIRGIEPIWKELPGAVTIEDVLERRAVSESVFPGSVYERIFYRELVIRRIPFEAQIPFQGGRGGLGGQVVDFIILDRPILVQVQTSPWHTGYANEEHDKEQKAILESLPHPVFRNQRNVVLYIWDWELDVPELTARWFRSNLEMNSWRAGWSYEGGMPTPTPEITLRRRYAPITGRLKRATGGLGRTTGAAPVSGEPRRGPAPTTRETRAEPAAPRVIPKAAPVRRAAPRAAPEIVRAPAPEVVAVAPSVAPKPTGALVRASGTLSRA